MCGKNGWKDNEKMFISAPQGYLIGKRGYPPPCLGKRKRKWKCVKFQKIFSCGACQHRRRHQSFSIIKAKFFNFCGDEHKICHFSRFFTKILALSPPDVKGYVRHWYWNKFFASGFALQSLPLTWGPSPRWLRLLMLIFTSRFARSKNKPKIPQLFA